MKKTNTLLFLLLLSALTATAQKPRLVVGIVVDQMRPDYLSRYESQFGEGGFKRLMREGYQCMNTHFSYVPTYTGPGHASIYTGATPSVHGIVANNWFDRGTRRMIYCTQDDSVAGTGSLTAAGKMSARNLLSPTLGDELRFFSREKSKVIGIALKDRGAILPAGHNANAAYWYENGNFISSNYYVKELPEWVSAFNKENRAAEYLKKNWDPMLPISEYTQSLPDENPYEGLYKGESKPVFPHELPKLMGLNGGLNLLRSTPFGNSLTLDFALACLEQEKLGKDDFTDLLAISFSSTDYVGHQFGIDAIETQDTYLRLDKDLERLLAKLDQVVGKGEYLVFLTADHAGVRTPEFLKDRKVPGGYSDEKSMSDSLKAFFFKGYGDSLVLAYENQQFYLNHEKITALKIRPAELYEAARNFLLKIEPITIVLTREELNRHTSFQDEMSGKMAAGFFDKRCGDLLIAFRHGYTEYQHTGTTHGSGFDYDTHVPLIFFGKGIKPGKDWTKTEISDIAPTLSAILNIPMPGGNQGKPIERIFAK